MLLLHYRRGIEKLISTLRQMDAFSGINNIAYEKRFRSDEKFSQFAKICQLDDSIHLAFAVHY